MQAVILAAGLGSRLGEYKLNKPKGFLVLDGMQESLIERSIRILFECGISEIIIVTGFLSQHYDELCKKYPKLKSVKNFNYKTTGSAQSLGVAISELKEDFLLLESDLLYEKKAIEILLENKSKNIILASGMTQSGDEVFLELDESKRLKNLSKNRLDLQHIDAELVGITKISLQKALSLDFYSCKDYEYLLRGLEVLKIDQLVWCEIDCWEHLCRAKEVILPRILQGENRC